MPALTTVATLILLSVPLAFASAALLVSGRECGHGRKLWQPGRWATGMALPGSVAILILALATPAFSAHLPAPGTPALGFVFALLSVRVDAVTGLMLSLIAFLGWVIVRFSASYLQDEPRQKAYLKWLLLTLSAIATLVVTNNLLVLAAAWIATSLSLHRLLTFFQERPQAQLAAHKKFIISRIAELCLIGGIYLTASTLHTVQLDHLYAAVAHLPSLPWTLEAAALLFAGSVILQCAQLPFQGWLIQVMEAPTPVSALLHAGIINIGGFFMIRLMPLMAPATAAQTLLVVVGSATATLAALTMLTQNSIKGSLAWSSCAQMGFMLLECGLGAYGLALLHLIAHSLYKGHAFLSSASVVGEQRRRLPAAAAAKPALLPWIVAPLVSLGMVASVAVLFGAAHTPNPAILALVAILGLALPPLFAARSLQVNWRHTVAMAAVAAATASLYFIWHALFTAALSPHALHAAPASGRAAFVVAAFLALYVIQVGAEVFPRSRLMRALLPHFRAGLHIDAVFTSLALRIWPVRLAPEGTDEGVLAALSTHEV